MRSSLAPLARVERIADEAAKAGRRRSVGEAYLRASEYYRASYFFDRVDLTGFIHRDAATLRRDHLGEDARGVRPRCRRVGPLRRRGAKPVRPGRHDWRDGFLVS